jgi:hypothetical protein
VTDDTGVYPAIDPAHSMRLTRPMNIDEVRKSNPQGVIDYLVQRKEFYKCHALALNKKLAEAEAQHRTHFARLKRRLKEETAMKNSWKYTCLAVGAGAVFVGLAVLVVSLSASRASPEHAPKMPTSGTTPATPSRVLAAVNIFNGDKQGSGVVVSKGDKFAAVLSAAHNFSGKIGGTFWVYYADGTFTKGTLLAVDRDRDLALARVDADTIIGHSYVPEAVVPGEISGVGYTGAQGPNYRKLTYNAAYWNAAKKYMWEFGVREGPFWDGDSGSGVFIGDGVVGVTSQRDAYVVACGRVSKRLYACSLEEIRGFLTEHAAELAGCGDYRLPPEVPAGADDAPPAWTPTPNVPVHVASRTDKLLADLKADVDMLKAGGLKKPSDVGPPDPGLKRPSEIK